MASNGPEVKEAGLVSGNETATYADLYEHAFDAKGRITVPAPWRSERHEKRLLIARSKDGCLKVYPRSFLDRQHAKLAGASLDDPRRQKLQQLASALQEVECDAQGRIMVKDKCRQHAGLKREAVLVGFWDHFQIWPADRWKARSEEETSFEQLAREAGL
jgi:MraZ protein